MHLLENPVHVRTGRERKKKKISEYLGTVWGFTGRCCVPLRPDGQSSFFQDNLFQENEGNEPKTDCVHQFQAPGVEGTLEVGAFHPCLRQLRVFEDKDRSVSSFLEEKTSN